jgi:hypothetical protein
VGARGRISIKDAIVTNASEHLAAHVGQVMADGDRVIAGVEDEERDFSLAGQEPDEAPDLLNGGCRGIKQR